MQFLSSVLFCGFFLLCGMIPLLYTCRCTQIKTHAWSNCCVCLVGNKCDMEASREVSTRQGQELASELGNTLTMPHTDRHTHTHMYHTQSFPVFSGAGSHVIRAQLQLAYNQLLKMAKPKEIVLRLCNKFLVLYNKV